MVKENFDAQTQRSCVCGDGESEQSGDLTAGVLKKENKENSPPI